MKLNLLSLTILFQVAFVISDTEQQPYNYKYLNRIYNLLELISSSEEDVKNNTEKELIEETTVHEVPNSSETPKYTEVTENNEETTIKTVDLETVKTTTESSENISELTTEISSTITAINDNMVCLRDESLFTKHDLNAIINFISEHQLKILSVISDGYQDLALNVSNQLLEEFNTFKETFEERPEHLNHILDDMRDTREKKIVPLVQTALATLQEFPAITEDFYRISNKTMKMLDYLEKSKNICENNCNNYELLRKTRSLSMRTNTVIERFTDEDYLCSTIETVYLTVQDRLSKFAQEEIENSHKYILDKQEHFEIVIEIMKIDLREAALSQFGMTMFEILNLYDDHFHFMKALREFNENLYASSTTRTNKKMEYVLLSLDSKTQKYRQKCLSCNQVILESRFGEDNVKIQTDPDRTILDLLLSEKMDEIKLVVKTAIDRIFKELNDTFSDSEFVGKTIAKLTPVQDTVSNRTIQEKHDLEEMMNQVSRKSRDNVKYVFNQAKELSSTISETLKFFS